MTNFVLMAQFEGPAEAFQVVVFYQAEIVKLQDWSLVGRSEYFDFRSAVV